MLMEYEIKKKSFTIAKGKGDIIKKVVLASSLNHVVKAKYVNAPTTPAPPVPELHLFIIIIINLFLEKKKKKKKKIPIYR
mgnify:CR=1 FL=1